MESINKSNNQMFSVKKIQIQYSIKKHMLTREWNEEENIDDPRKNIKIHSTTKKSVKFSNKVEEIPSFNEDIAPNTPDKPIISNEKRMRSCKEHMKTPYSKERLSEEKAVEINGDNNDNNDDNVKKKSIHKRSIKERQNKSNAQVDSPHFKDDISEISSENSNEEENSNYFINEDEQDKNQEKETNLLNEDIMEIQEEENGEVNNDQTTQ